MSRVLIMNGAGAGRGQSNLIALMEGEVVVAFLSLAGRGASEHFAPSLQELLRQAGWQEPPDYVAAIVGPGSFTGLRASLSLAAGLVRGWGCRGIGVRLGDALRASLCLHHVADDAVTALCLARRGRVFVDSPGRDVYALPTAEIRPGMWQCVAGDAVSGDDALAELTGAEGLLASGAVRHVYPWVAPDALGILYAARQAEVQGRNLPLRPLYIDPPEARLPAAGLRSAPI